MMQGLADSEEFVIYKVLKALQALVVSDLIKKEMKRTFLGEVSDMDVYCVSVIFIVKRMCFISITEFITS